MQGLCTILYLVVCGFMLVGCGFPRPADVGDDTLSDALVDSGPAEPVLPSCAMPAATCGADGHDNCCESLDVPGGTYYRLYDVGGDSQSKTPIYPATVSAFRLDKYEVTVGRFRSSAGGDQQRPYPWSDPPTSLAIDSSRAAYLDSTTTVLQVGAKPADNARWGHSDMAGNVSEWVFDALGSYQVPCIDCVNPDGPGGRTFRGGGFTYGATEIRTTSLKGNPPTYRFINLGVRCARALL